MKPEILVWLRDVIKSIEEIESYFERFPKTFARFNKDTLLRRGIERNLEIIGEAIRNILREDPTIKITDAARIVSTRNRIIHGYSTVENDVIWRIVIKNIPVLKKEVEALIETGKNHNPPAGHERGI